MVHVVINNGAHESVGGMPTAAGNIDLPKIAEACGYENAVSVSDFKALDHELKKSKEMNVLSFIEVKCAIGSRKDLGRPSTTPKENINNFMQFLNL